MNHSTRSNEDLEETLTKAFNDFYDYITEKDIIKTAHEYTEKTVYKTAFDSILSWHITQTTKLQAEARKREIELLDSLYWMYVQYCSKDGHLFMGAGEGASELLEDAGYITVDGAGSILKDNCDSQEQAAQLEREHKVKSDEQ